MARYTISSHSHYRLFIFDDTSPVKQYINGITFQLFIMVLVYLSPYCHFTFLLRFNVGVLFCFAGVCFTGLSDRTSLIGYVIAPQVVYLTLGTIFLIAGFISLFNIRNVIKHSGTKTNKLEKLMIRIGIFSVLYTVPAITVIACNIYELLHRDMWIQKFIAQISCSKLYSGALSCPPNAVELMTSSGPDFAWFVLKYLGYLIVGITSGFWIWSNKTMSSWGSVIKHLCCCCFSKQPREAAV